jgi:hypothetical protein
MKEYKVLVVKEKTFADKYDPIEIQNSLNSFARQGWILSTVFPALVPPSALKGIREHAIIILERDIS